MTQATLFDFDPAPAPPPTSETAPATPDLLELAAHRLAARFAESDNLPARLRPRAAELKPDKKKSASQENSKREARFRVEVRVWKQTLDHLCCHFEPSQAWAFINLSPAPQEPAARPADHGQLTQLLDYLELRRDQEQCGDAELTALSQLVTAFQERIENQR